MNINNNYNLISPIVETNGSYNYSIEIKKSFENLDKILSSMPDYKEEYLDFRLIKRISFNLLDNESLLFENFSIIDNMLNLFSDIIHTKLTTPPEKYEIEYEKFSLNLLDCKKEYYTKVFKKSEDYEMSNTYQKSYLIFFKENDECNC